jgi:hypothetical protein
MKAFPIGNGRQIELSMTIGAAMRVRNALQVDLTNVHAPVTVGGQVVPLCVALQGMDVMLLVDVLYQVCLPGLTAHGVDAMGFAELMGGEALQLAKDAFFAEWEDFFHKLNRLEAVRTIQACQEAMRAMINKATRLAANAEAEFIALMSSPNATASPGPSAAEIPAA